MTRAGTTGPWPEAPVAPTDVKDPEGNVLTPLGKALLAASWSRALDALRDDPAWDLGPVPRQVLMQTLNTAPLDVLDELLGLGMPVRPVPDGLARPLVCAWFAQGPRDGRRIAVLDRLLEHGVSIDQADARTGTTFLSEACRTWCTDHALALLDRGADPNRASCQLVVESWLREPDLEDWLLRGWTPLHLVAQWPRERLDTAGLTLVQRLLDAGARPDARTELPWTHMDAFRRHTNRRPPTPDERTAGHGWTPVDVAMHSGSPAVAALIERHALRAEPAGSHVPSPSSPSPTPCVDPADAPVEPRRGRARL